MISLKDAIIFNMNLEKTEEINEARRKRRSEKFNTREAQGMSIIDQYINGDADIKTLDFIKPNGPTIYAFTTNKVRNAIKIGYTDQHPEKRIEQWRDTYGKEAGDVVLLGYWSAEEFDKAGERVFFWDFSVHEKVNKRGYLNIKKDEFHKFLSIEGEDLIEVHYSREFFRKYKTLISGEMDYNEADKLSDKLIEDIIKEMRDNIKAGTEDFKTYKFDSEGNTTRAKSDKIWGAPATYSNTDLQEEAVKNALSAIESGKKKLLMAAVMRFGKTHASYDIVNRAKMKKVLVTSGKADVRKAWRDDINHKSFCDSFVFVEVIDKYKCDISYKKGSTIVTESRNIYEDTDIMSEFISEGKTVIVFATLQDLSGSLNVIKSKHKKFFDSKFDMLIIDETHYGSHSPEWGKVSGITEEDIDEEAIREIKMMNKDKETVDKLNIKYDILLQVSGTPYYILASNEMLAEDAEVISKVSYTDMVKARDKWEADNRDKDSAESPYFGIPTLHKIGLELTSDCKKAIAKTGAIGSISKLFEVKSGRFVHEKAISKLMTGIFGDGKSKQLAFLNNKKVKGDRVCKHTLLRMPSIASCEALKNLLESVIDTSERKVINIVGSRPDVKSIEDLNSTLEKLDNSGKMSVMLTVNKMMTGVSIPLLDSMIYLRDSSSPQDYDQAIFRLCTRNVKTVKDPDEGAPKKVNMKENVYLIDFNITNMFNMVANSARMKAAAEGNASSERIEELISDDLETVSLFAERGDEISNKMHKVDVKDMLEIYVRYNSNKSITDIANDDINLFIGLFEDKRFQNMVSSFDVENDKTKNVIGIDPSTTTDTISLDGLPDAVKKKMMSLRDYIENSYDSKEKRRALRETQEKFKTIVKMLMFCNLTLETPFKDMESLLRGADRDTEFRKMLTDFEISLSDLRSLYNYMDVTYKMLFNQMLLRIAMLAEDMRKSDPSKFNTAISGLGRLGDNEVVTPNEIVKKMIAKLDKSVYRSAKSILLVNEKHGEFFEELCSQFGKENMAEKCKIAPSSMKGYYLIRTKLNNLGLSEYINKIILSIEDVDGNSKYDINDFLKMNDSDIMKENNGKKFDVVLMNPPYDNGLCNRFLEKVFSIANKIVTVQPLSWLISKKQRISITKQVNNFDTYIDTINGVQYFDAAIKGEMGIQYFDTTSTGKIHIYDKVFDRCEDVKLWSNDSFLEEFVENLGHINNSLWDNIKGTTIYDHNYESNPNDDWWCVKIQKIRGRTQKNEERFAPKFYTLISNNETHINANKGKYKYLKQRPNNNGNYDFLYFAFNTEKELNNFINYIKTDFVRVCLMLTKTNANLHRGELKYIPWLDFSDAVFSKSPKEIDDYLFKKYNISNDIRKHIEEILPDYYKIR